MGLVRPDVMSLLFTRAQRSHRAEPGRNEVEDPFRGWRREHV